MIEVRDAAGADVPRLRDIRYAAFARHAPSAYSPAEVATLLADVDEAEVLATIGARQLFVACSAGAVVGLAGRKDGWLRHVCVAPATAERPEPSIMPLVIVAWVRGRPHMAVGAPVP